MRFRRPEEVFQAQVIKLAKLRGWRVAHFRAVRVQRANGSVYYETPVAADGKGFLDLVLTRRRDGRLVVVELKVPPNGTTPEQEEWIGDFLAAGVPTYVWTPEDWPTIEVLLS